MQKETKLLELTNIAAKQASASLTKLSGEKVTVEVTKSEITKVKAVYPDIAPEAIVAGIYLPVTGDIQGASLLIFPEKVAYAICDLLVKRESGTTHKLNELDKSALMEVGNILCGNFLTVLSNALKIKIVENVPCFSLDMYGAIMEQIVAQFANSAEEALVVEVKFHFEYADIKGYIVLIFGFEHMAALVKTLKDNE